MNVFRNIPLQITDNPSEHGSKEMRERQRERQIPRNKNEIVHG